MAVNYGIPTSLRTPKGHVTQPTVFPAPLGGMDARVPLAVDSPNTCIWAINMVPNEYSMRVRKGWREWQEGMTEEVRTVIPYVGRSGTDRIFAATKDGIYECTTYAGTPSLKVAFTTKDADAGFGVYMSYVDESGDDLMFYADGSNGLFRYDPETNIWAQATGIQSRAGSFTTLDITKVVFVTVHKLRVWLIEKNANKAWYLPIRSAMGDATEYFFAQKFRAGGDLVGLYNWTIDGGQGRDDHLVAISRGGDVIPWTGEDPADTTTWTSTGTFNIGPVPYGHRVASEYGGELFVLSKYGVTTMSGLMAGMVIADPFTNVIGHKISRLLREDLKDYGNSPGWSIKFVTDIGSLLITMPKRSDGRYRQYVYNIATEGWGTWRDVPLLSGDSWQGALMIGDETGRLLRMDQNRDDVQTDGSGGDPIEWFVLTSYNHLQAPAVFKRAKLVRCNFIAETEPLYKVSVHYDYTTTEPEPASGSPTPVGGSVWGTGLWGEAFWSFSISEPFSKLLGGSGIGRSVAVALVGSSVSETDLASIDLLWETGGMM